MGHLPDVPGVVLLGSDFKALGVIRSLGRRGIPSVVIDNQPRAAWWSRYVASRYRWRAGLDDPALVAFLVRMGQTRALQGWLLLPAQDEAVELVARYHQALSPCYRLATPPWSIVRWALDKRLTYRMARELDVAFPATWYPASAHDLASCAATLPAIIKPAISVRLQYTTRLKALPARTLCELRAQYAVAARNLPPDEIMVQEIIPGGGESQFSLAAYCVDGEITTSMTARRTRQYPIDFGLSSSFVEAVEVPALLEPATRIVRFMRLTGMVELEFKRDRRDQSYKLLDINVRPWGWHTLCIACGLDFSAIQYYHLLGRPVESPTPTYGARWLRVLTDIPAAWHEVSRGAITPGAYARSLLGPTTFSVLEWRDLAPTAGDAFAAAARTLRRALTPRRPPPTAPPLLPVAAPARKWPVGEPPPCQTPDHC